VELAEAVRTGRTTSRQLVELYLDRIARRNGELNAVVTVDADGVRRRADALDAEQHAGRSRGPLHGVPMTVKDAFATAGIRTTSGSEERAQHVPAEDAVAVARLLAAGVVILGKTNVPEGITGQETANSLFGRTNNPWDLGRTPGGSSGGAAAAVAAGLSALELGSDSGGSLRQPAHCCGVYSHIPTQGLVPLRGHLPLVPMEEIGMQVDLMGVGPMARRPLDLAVALQAIAGPDVQDQRAWRMTLPVSRLHGLADARVVLWSGDDDFPLAGGVRQALDETAERLEAAGAVVDRAARPDFSLAEAERVAFALWVASTTMSTDNFSELEARAATVTDDREDRPARRLRAEVMSHHEWTRLDGERRRMARAWEALLADHDVVLCPVSPVVAVPHDPEPSLVADLDHRLARTIDVDGRPRPYLEQMTWNIVVGMAGLPSTVAPIGWDATGLPIGVQIVGPRFADLTTIAFADALAGVTGGYRPPTGTAVGASSTGE
jgi:amidase